eukprot:542421-Rhodomonas_salina.2
MASASNTCARAHTHTPDEPHRDSARHEAAGPCGMPQSTGSKSENHGGGAEQVDEDVGGGGEEEELGVLALLDKPH